MAVTTVDVLVIGAGAAGLMCAATAGYRGRSVQVLEHSRQIGRKIRMSGGGRCNFTNLHNGPQHYLSENPHFCRSALSRYPARDFIALVERHGIAYHEKTLGQLFCDHSSREIVQMLVQEADWAGARIVTECTIERVIQTSAGFQVDTSQGRFVCQSLVVATGGLSIPNGGATPFAYRLAEQFGLTLVPTRAALVPLRLPDPLLAQLKPLAGISHQVEVSIGRQLFRESMLFTHRGLSGPAILQISSYWQPGTRVHINLLPDVDIEAWLQTQRQQRPRIDITTLLAEQMSKRMAQTLAALFGVGGQLAQQSNGQLAALARQLGDWQITPYASEGYRTAEVTLGGISTAEVAQQDMQAKQVPGLYFIGECLDVTGHLGGHNFQWAWASGVAAGQSV